MPPVLIISGLSLRDPFVGVGSYALRLIRGLDRQTEIEFKVLLPEDDDQAEALLPPNCCVRVKGRPPTGNSLVKSLYWMQRFATVARQDYPEAIFHSPGSFWSLRRPKHLVVTLHDCIYRRFPFYLGRFVLRKWMAFATERYAAGGQLVLTVSKCSADDLHDLANVPSDKIRIIHQWVEPRFNPSFAAEEAPRVRAKYGLPEKFFLYVGGYDYRKNVEFLIRAYALAREQGLAVPLVLAGRIPTRIDRTLCDVTGAIARAGLKLGSEVILPGFIDDADMPGLYGAGQVLVYPSLFEGFGYPPIEAIGCGKVALVADNSSLAEILPRAQNRFATRDPAELTSLLNQVNQFEEAYRVPLDDRFTEPAAIKFYISALREFFSEVDF